MISQAIPHQLLSLEDPYVCLASGLGFSTVHLLMNSGYVFAATVPRLGDYFTEMCGEVISTTTNNLIYFFSSTFVNVLVSFIIPISYHSIRILLSRYAPHGHSFPGREVSFNYAFFCCCCISLTCWSL